MQFSFKISIYWAHLISIDQITVSPKCRKDNFLKAIIPQQFINNLVDFLSLVFKFIYIIFNLVVLQYTLLHGLQSNF